MRTSRSAKRCATFFTTQIPQDIRDTVAARRELTKEQIVESMQVMNAAGIAVPNWPVEWGGKDWTPLQRHIWHEEMQLACVPPPLAFNASMVGPVIAAFGSQEIKERFLAKTANLDIWWSQGFSEPDAGSDLASLRTTAVREGDEYVVNGQKTWTTLGQYGDWIFTLVRTDPDGQEAGRHLVPADRHDLPGRHGPPDRADRRRPRGQRGVLRQRPRAGREPRRRGEQGLGLRQVPARQRARRRRSGRRRPSARWPRPRSYAKTAGPGGTSLLDDPLLAAQIAELENELLALELTALRVVAHSADGKPHPASSVLKLRGTELQQAVTELFVDLAGPAALASGAGDGSDVPDWARVSTPNYLNFRKASIYGGSNEVQRQIIAGTILGLRG